MWVKWFFIQLQHTTYVFVGDSSFFSPYFFDPIFYLTFLCRHKFLSNKFYRTKNSSASQHLQVFLEIRTSFCDRTYVAQKYISFCKGTAINEISAYSTFTWIIISLIVHRPSFWNSSSVYKDLNEVLSLQLFNKKSPLLESIFVFISYLFDSFREIKNVRFFPRMNARFII